MSGSCEVCGDELPDPFREDSYIQVEVTDQAVKIRQPDRHHNNEIVRKAKVCDQDCADEYMADKRGRLTGCYTVEIDYRDMEHGGSA